jgi:hypothetical protein
LEPFNPAGRLGLIKKAGIVEYVARSSLVRVMEAKSLWQYFKTKSSLMAFWDLAPADRESAWGAVIDPMDGLAGFDEKQYSDAELRSR